MLGLPACSSLLASFADDRYRSNRTARCVAIAHGGPTGIADGRGARADRAANGVREAKDQTAAGRLIRRTWRFPVEASAKRAPKFTASLALGSGRACARLCQARPIARLRAHGNGHQERPLCRRRSPGFVTERWALRGDSLTGPMPNLPT